MSVTVANLQTIVIKEGTRKTYLVLSEEEIVTALRKWQVTDVEAKKLIERAVSAGNLLRLNGDLLLPSKID